MRFVLLLILVISLFSQNDLSGIKAMGAPLNPKVDLRWNRFYDYNGIVEIMERIESAYPQLVKMESIGKSFEGRDIYVLKITDYKSGSDKDKSAMYIDGNIHSNEIQGAEVSLYTAWYLTESYASVKWIAELLKDKAFYIVPTINPDARDWYMKKANSAHSPRSGMIPTDNDLDGELDEDGPDDLDGNGHITRMRVKDPNGRWKKHPKYPEYMIRVDQDEKGEYKLFWSEGFDNDGDGRINEDGKGNFDYDPNRDWAFQWEPKYIQRGARKYPFSLPETSAVQRFVEKHPNIAGAQSYHNTGGMILRGPGKRKDKYNRSDLRVYDFIAKKGEEILPDYRYLVVWKDLYEVYGGELDWLYGYHGITTFSNELWTWKNMFRPNSKRKVGSRGEQLYNFNKHLLFGEAFVPWKKVKHPDLGEVEVGGFKKNIGRVPPSFLLEEECHRNMSFTLFHAYHLPQLKIKTFKHKRISNGLYEITIEIENMRVVPRQVRS